MLIIRGGLVVRPSTAFAVACLVILAIPLGALVMLVWSARWGAATGALVTVMTVTCLFCFPCLGDRKDDVGAGPGLPMQQQPAPDHGLGASAIAGLSPVLPMQQQPGPDQGLGASAIAGLPTYVYEKACGGGDECAVCLGEVQRGEVVKQLPACTHLFHEECIDAWLRAHVTCPVCRPPVDAALPAATEVVVRPSL